MFTVCLTVHRRECFCIIFVRFVSLILTVFQYLCTFPAHCIFWRMTLTPVRENYHLNQDRVALAVRGEKSILQFVERQSRKASVEIQFQRRDNRLKSHQETKIWPYALCILTRRNSPVWLIHKRVQLTIALITFFSFFLFYLLNLLLLYSILMYFYCI